MVVGEGGRVGYRRRRGDSHRQVEAAGAERVFFQDGGERKPLWYDGRKEESNMTNASCGWGQLDALGCVIRCDLTYFPQLLQCVGHLVRYLMIDSHSTSGPNVLGSAQRRS